MSRSPLKGAVPYLGGGTRLIRAISLAAVLTALWLLLSGHMEPLLLGLGAVSVAFVVWIAHRMDVVDREGHPIHLTTRFLTYLPWLAWEIVKANIDVTRRVLDPRLPVGPTVFRVAASQKSELGHVIYANSITLTPGTVTIDIDGDVLVVHALTREAAEGVMTGEMDRRVSAVEGLG